MPILLRAWWMPASLVGVAATLILFNGVALLSSGFFAAWSDFLPWIGAIGSFGVILGVVLGLLLVGAIVIMLLGFKVLSAFVILPTAVVSIFIGGGFIIGAILAVLAGILLLL
jgi:hypothetical protein